MAKELETIHEGVEKASVDVRGTRMHYLRAGSGPPVVVIHGLVGSSANWLRNVTALASHASVYALDMVNVGMSARVAGVDATLAATADRVAACMDALGLDKADIAAHSHGGAVALMLAARHPQRVRTLMLFAPANPFCRMPDPMVRLYASAPGNLLARTAAYLPRPIQLIALGRMYGNPGRIAPGCMQTYIDLLRAPGTVEHILAIVRCWFADMAALKAVLPQVAHVPTMLIWGDRDRAMSVASGSRLKQQMTNSELIVVPGAGHVLFEELPEEANRAMRDWLRRSHESCAEPQCEPSIQQHLEQSHPATPAARTPINSTLGRLSPGV